MVDTLAFNPDLVRLDTLERLYRQQSAVRLTPSAAVPRRYRGNGGT